MIAATRKVRPARLAKSQIARLVKSGESDFTSQILSDSAKSQRLHWFPAHQCSGRAIGPGSIRRRWHHERSEWTALHLSTSGGAAKRKRSFWTLSAVASRIRKRILCSLLRRCSATSNGRRWRGVAPESTQPPRGHYAPAFASQLPLEVEKHTHAHCHTEVTR